MIRIGIGYDIHPLVEGRPLILGGIKIPSTKGLLGHSDADVLLHAIIDALLGAMAKGDIGELFPDTDVRFKDISSIKLLEKVNSLLKESGFKIVNIDTTVLAEAPKLSPFKEEMVCKISEVLGINRECVNIKAKTNEKFDAVGRGEAIASFAVALLEK